MAKLRFKKGTMNSSKSAQLLMTRHNYIEQGKKVIIFKPTLDTRDGAHAKSRALDKKAPAVLIDNSATNKMFNLAGNLKPDCVLIDEVQFMPEHQIDELAKIVDLLNIPVIAYGLLTDFKGKLFPGSKRLLEVGAKVEDIKTVCWDCSKAAVYNMRLFNGSPVFHGEQVQVGGNESYKPVCRCCYAKAEAEAKVSESK